MTPSKVIRSNRRTLSISINDQAELIVRAPHKLSISKIHDFINEKAKWINKQQKIVNNPNCLLLKHKNNKISRNEKCLVTGKKFKHCCGAL